MTARPVGRRPGDPDNTRADILDAARQRFAEVGFDRATIRSIAELASVDPALVGHHFGNKQQLFASAHELPFNPADLLDQVTALPPDQRPRALIDTFLRVVLADDSPGLSLIRAAATNESAAAMMREFITDVFLAQADRWELGPDGRLRLALAGSHIVGLVFGRNIIGIEPLHQADIDELADLITPAIEHYIG